DLDWWYTSDSAGLDMQRVPTAKLAAKIVNKLLTAGPGRVLLNMTFGGMPTLMRMSSTTVNVTVNGTSAPAVSMNMMPPGHLPSENLDPMLVSYASTGQPNANGAGKMCGNIAASPLAKLALTQ